MTGADNAPLPDDLGRPARGWGAAAVVGVTLGAVLALANVALLVWALML